MRAHATLPRTRKIPRRKRLAVSSFVRDFSRTSTPVIISGAMAGWPTWQEDHVAARCGTERLVQSSPLAGQAETSSVLVHEAGLRGDSWAAMRELNASELRGRGLLTLANLLHAQRNGEPLYLHDESIERLCPRLLGDLRAPKYFPVDYRLQTGALHAREQPRRRAHPSANGRWAHPSLFVGPAGTQSGLHADSQSSRSWMAVHQGTKRFRLFNRSEAERLYPTNGVPGNHHAANPVHPYLPTPTHPTPPRR